LSPSVAVFSFDSPLDVGFDEALEGEMLWNELWLANQIE
jgi:hypothetical protein